MKTLFMIHYIDISLKYQFHVFYITTTANIIEEETQVNEPFYYYR